MKVIRQLLIAWMLVAFLALQGFGQDAKPPPPPKPLPLPTKIITKSVSDENSSGNDDKLKLTTIKQRRTIKIPPRKPVPVLDWSDFIYNSPEEKAFWGELTDWSSKILVRDWKLNWWLRLPDGVRRRNTQGETIESNSSEGFNGYVKLKYFDLGLPQRSVLQFVDGYAVRAKSWFKSGQKESEANFKEGEMHGVHTAWYVNGQKKEETNYNENKLMNAKVWLPDGKECPKSKVIDGNGTLVTYSLDGKAISRSIVTDGRTIIIPPRNPLPIPKRPASSEANSSKPLPPSPPPWLVPAAPK